MIRWFALYLAGSALFLAPLSFRATTHLPDDGDSLQGIWILWWSATHWRLGFPGILDANGYYPHPKALLFSEPQFAEAFLATPLFYAFDNHVLVYNAFLLVTLGLSALSAHLLLRELTGSSAAAFVGAVAYVFNGYTLSQLSRSQLVTLQWIPLGLLGLHLFFSRRDGRYLVLFSLFSILQGLASLYYLQFYVLLLGAVVPFYFVAYPSPSLTRRVGLLLASGLACALALFFLVRPIIELFQRSGFSSVPETMDLSGFFIPAADNPLYAWFSPTPIFVVTFLGYGALVLAVLGGLRLARGSLPLSIGAGYLLAGVLAFLLAGGPDLIFAGARIGPGPFRILQLFGPPLGSIRDPGRFAIIVRLVLAIFVAIGAAKILERSSGIRRIVLTLLLATFVAAEQWSKERVQGVEIPVGERIPAAYSWAAHDVGRGPLVELPVRPFAKIRWNSLDAYFSTHHRRPYLFGKPSVYPPAHELLRTELLRFPEPDTLELLASLGVELLVVYPHRWNEAERGSRMRLLEQAERERALIPRAEFRDGEDDLSRRYGLGPAIVYRIAIPAREPSSESSRCREIDRSRVQVRGSGTHDARLAIDGDSRTSWMTGLYQGKGSYFEIDFGEMRKPVRIEIELVYPFIELPRRLAINGFRGERFWRIARRDGVPETLALVHRLVSDPANARLGYDLEPMDVDRIRLFIEGGEPTVPGWSIPEIHVFESDVP